MNRTAEARSARQLAERLLPRIEPTGERHAWRVASLSWSIACQLTVSATTLSRVVAAAWLHDCGKIVWPTRLTRGEPLRGAADLALIRAHPLVGARYVERFTSLAALAPIICHHHERWDGSGYPHSLAGEAIPLESRIIAVADAWAVMERGRAYCPTRDDDFIAAELHSERGGQFDAAVVDGALGLLAAPSVAC